MPEIIMAENHEQVYPVWVERGMRDISVTHLDFHCDMRGLMIERDTGTAYFTSHWESTFIDRGNFLGHAIMNGIVTDLRWVHGPRGGRAFDVGPVVAYDKDFMAPLHRFRHKRSGRKEVQFKFWQGLLDDWDGMREGEQLDLDWDAFASVEYSPEYRKQLVEAFLARDFLIIPEITFLVYSPGYSDPDVSLYEEFAERLSDKFGAEIVRLPWTALNTDGEKPGRLRKFIKAVAPPQVRQAKRGLSKAWRRFESAKDLDAFAK